MKLSLTTKLRTKKLVILGLICFTTAQVVGCAAISHRNLDVQAKMSDTIFLNPETLESGKPIYVRAINTSDFQEIDFNNLLKEKIAKAGRKITSNPKEAAYLLQANLLYLNQEKQDMTMEGAVASGVGGAIAGATLASNSNFGGQSLAAAGVGLAAAGVGALVGSMVHVDTYIGLTDIQIKENVEGGVHGEVKSNLAQGVGTNIQTTQQISDTRQEFRTRIGVKAVQTNIDRKEATETIAERLASQIASYFR